MFSSRAVLKSRNMHDDVHFIFSQVWQARVAAEDRARPQETRWEEWLGAQDFAEIRRIKAWLDSHPKKYALYANLLHPQD